MACCPSAGTGTVMCVDNAIDDACVQKESTTKKTNAFWMVLGDDLIIGFLVNIKTFNII